MIFRKWLDFRRGFAIRGITSNVSLDYDGGSLHQITRAAGSFITDGHVAGADVDVTGTLTNNGRYRIQGVSALTLTLTADSGLAFEGPLTSSLHSATYDVDGVEAWPTNLIRIGNTGTVFNAITGTQKPVKVIPFTLTANGGAFDAAAGVDEYDWYVSQRTDDMSTQYLNVTRAVESPSNTRSGSILINLNSNAVTKFGLVDAFTISTDAQRVGIFRDVWVYVRRRSDGAIQLVNLLNETLAQ